MIADDELFNYQAIEIILKHVFQLDTTICDHASDGEKALKLVVDNVHKNGGRSCDYALILMDCNMPFVDGYEATSRIRQYLYACGVTQPVISAITGHIEPSYLEKAYTSGMNQVFSKPVVKELLQDVLERLYYI